MTNTIILFIKIYLFLLLLRKQQYDFYLFNISTYLVLYVKLIFSVYLYRYGKTANVRLLKVKHYSFKFKLILLISM